MRIPALEALQSPHYRRFWIAQTISLVGSWLQSSALSWLVLNIGSNQADASLRLGIVNTLQWTPSLLLSLFAGALSDRFNKRTLLLFSQFSLMLVSLCLGYLVLFGRVSFAVLCSLALVMGLANVFDIVARQSLIPTLVTRNLMPRAIALNSLSFNLSRIAGGALFGVLAPVLGLGPLFIFNAASFLGVFRALYLLPQYPESENQPTAGTSLAKEVWSGLQFVWRTKAVRTPIVLMAAMSLTVINFQIIIPSFAKFGLGLGESGFGWLSSGFGVGAAIGALAQAVSPKLPRRLLLRLGAFGLIASMFALVFAKTLLVAAGIFAVAGFSMILFAVSANSSVQLSTPDALRGRVMSVYNTVFAGMTPFGAMLSAVLLGQLGLRLGLACLATLALVLMAAEYWLLKKV